MVVQRLPLLLPGSLSLPLPAPGRPPAARRSEPAEPSGPIGRAAAAVGAVVQSFLGRPAPVGMPSPGGEPAGSGCRPQALSGGTPVRGGSGGFLGPGSGTERAGSVPAGYQPDR